MKLSRIFGLAAFCAASLATVTTTTTPASAQVGTYQEDNGTIKNRLGVQLDGAGSATQVQCINTVTPPTVPGNSLVTLQCDGRGRLITSVIAISTPTNAATNTITTASVSQQVFAINTARTYLFCQNPVGSATTLYMEIGAAASVTGNAYELAPGGSITLTGSGTVFTNTVNVLSATAGARFICKQG